MFLDEFQHVRVIDFEFNGEAGGHPEPVCLVVSDPRTGERQRYWMDELRMMRQAPYPTGDDAVTVAYYAPAEMSCFMALGWPLPAYMIDLYPEYMNRVNGLPAAQAQDEGDVGPGQYSLLGALAFFGLDGIGHAEKADMRNLVLRGGPFTPVERAAILDYCQSDVDGTVKLLGVMAPSLTPPALFRGRYMKAVAAMERTGIPLDRAGFQEFLGRWQVVRDLLIAEVDEAYNVFVDGSFNMDRFAQYVVANNIAWPLTPTGRLAVSEDVFKEQVLRYPQLAPLRDLLKTLGTLRRLALVIGPDGRARTGLRPFASKTGRNQPSNAKFIFGAPAWMRAFVQPVPGRALALLDFEQQEYGVAAALSGDVEMQRGYATGDPYISFGQRAGKIPPNGTKASHGALRDMFKTVVLGIQYCMGAQGLAERLGIAELEAQDLLDMHRRAYPQFWRWAQAAADYAFLRGRLDTVYGWGLWVHDGTGPRTVQNFPVQTTASEILRLACCLAIERGVQVCAPVHDAILIEAADADIEAATESARRAMVEASEVVLGGFPIRVEVSHVVRYPDRLITKKGRPMWERVQRILQQIAVEAA